MADPRAGTGTYKISTEHLVVPENKKILKIETVGACQKDPGANMKESQLPNQKNLSNKINYITYSIK